MEDVAYQVDGISQINDVIEVEQITSLCDTMVKVKENGDPERSGI